MMRQKLTIIGALALMFLLTGCEQAAAPVNQQSNSSTVQNNTNNSSNTVQNNGQQSDVSAVNQTGSNQIATTQTETQKKEKGKMSIMLKMIEDGLEIASEQSTQKQGLTMIERGVSLLASASSNTELSAKMKDSIAALQKNVALFKDEKTLAEGLKEIEKNLTEAKANL